MGLRDIRSASPARRLRLPAPHRPYRSAILLVAAQLASLLAAVATYAADVDDAAELFRTGRYEECIRLCEGETRRPLRDEQWDLWKIKSEMAVGKYQDAHESLDAAVRRAPGSLELYLLGRDVRKLNGKSADEPQAAAEIEQYLRRAPFRYSTPDAQVALGRFLMLKDIDPKRILDQCYDAVIKRSPKFTEAYLAAAELALEKQDYGLAAETLRKAPEEAAEDPYYHYLMASAFAEDDRAQAAKSLEAALKINPRHVESLLLQADGLIDGERYDDAVAVIQKVLDVNPHEPRAWAFKAVLAHLRNDRTGEDDARRTALAPWPENPAVDSLIGRKLAEKYRFAEAAAYQRQALTLAPDDFPAKLELCQALLRLGEEAEGWKLADEIFARDGYNVVAFNLVSLHDRLTQFKTLEADGLVVRMEPREAALYGNQVLALLKRAKGILSQKYRTTLPTPVIVEIFPAKREFAVRTFGLPGADGLLGVCFGRVITANSPASQGEHPSNWEAVLWHELCHAVTLGKTHNKMPRWLSEGISVYEEGEQDPAWATALNPRFRAMLLGDDLVPISRLSSAFLAPKSAQHIQFAYFESALAVRYLVEKAGFPAIAGLLDDLGAGKTINDALPARTGMTLDQLDHEFLAFARKLAADWAPEATWEEVEMPAATPSDAVSAWLKQHLKSFWGHQRLALALMREEKWPEAKAALLSFKAMNPHYIGADNAYLLLAEVSKRLSDPAGERAALQDLVARNGNASEALLRLMELGSQSGDWKSVATYAQRLLAVNPLIPAPHRYLARAAEQLGRRADAITAYRALALLEETDVADVHFRLARLLHEEGQNDEARREVLMCLEDAPRSLEAHQLLLKLVKPAAPGTAPPGTPAPKEAAP